MEKELEQKRPPVETSKEQLPESRSSGNLPKDLSDDQLQQCAKNQSKRKSSSKKDLMSNGSGSILKNSENAVSRKSPDMMSNSSYDLLAESIRDNKFEMKDKRVTFLDVEEDDSSERIGDSNDKDLDGDKVVLSELLQEKKIQALQQQMNSSKIFMNMLVHDMRNPASSIEFGIQESLDHLQE